MIARKKHSRSGLTTITFKGSAANRVFAQIAVAHAAKGEDPRRNMVPDTELHRMTTEEIAKTEESQKKS
jgi:hypothetical protein